MDPGSFRDPHSRVFHRDGQVRRALSPEGRRDIEALEAAGLLTDPRLVPTSWVDDPEPPMLLGGTAGVLEHERVPFLSYPYEWCFSMLKDAALLQLDLVIEALQHDLMIKDASPYNIQFVGACPLFIDVGSFERLRPDELWVAYRQFCTLYLYPLMLQARGFDPRPLLRGSVDGVRPGQMRALTSFRDRFRRGYLLHVMLLARLERRATGASARRQPRNGKAVIEANVRSMRRLVSRQHWAPPSTVWTGYGEDNSYSDPDAEAKDAFVREVAAERRWSLVWDLGCNNGRHSRLLAPHADVIVAVDGDHATVDRLYRELRGTQDGAVILPLVMDLADPSPGLGWRGAERPSFAERGRPDLVLALALVHHLVIAANVPVAEVIDWLASFGAAVVLELPTPEDPMVRQLLAGKREGLHPDYDRAVFERHLHAAFDVRRSLELSSGTRVLYYVTPRGD